MPSTKTAPSLRINKEEIEEWITKQPLLYFNSSKYCFTVRELNFQRS